MRRCTETLDSSRTPAHRTRSSGRGRGPGVAAIGTGAIGTIITEITPSLLAALGSHSLGSGTLSDTATAIPTVATTLPLTMAAVTMGPVTTEADITATVTTAAVLMVQFTPATPTGRALAPNRV
jgi:hypothetical protein